ncbi:TPPP family protein CG45057-like [Hyposmocoma kahamanoa]|uniref:TPPP family protein CG45057-like n=1 Tax=Hyposmocoma kahamanoa TaxID=1477025 RepID=UPI000E6D7924|nr:TPPP family protein CG45057-like [Hyposmocoma kahamanoa]
MAGLEKVFTEYAKFGNPKNDGKTITLSNVDKWLKDAGITDGKKVTTTDTGIAFQKLKSKAITFSQFNEFLDGLCKSKSLNLEEVKGKLEQSSPSKAGTTAADASGVVNRMTDTTKYTGTHKERFDAEGKGKGQEGRTDATDNTGYVSGYKNKDTFDKKK